MDKEIDDLVRLGEWTANEKSKADSALRTFLKEEYLTVKANGLLCSICHDVVITPCKCKKCEQIYCSTCIEQWL